ncbi:MAG: recombinase family protein [Anaerolineae bacterium]|nr:recombinase family protein [Anaerolineae bacterium]
MKTIGYIRVSTDEQDLSKQKHLLLEYAQQHKFVIDEFIEVEVSSRKDQRERRISDKGIKIIFVRQPELSTSGMHGKLLLAIYSYIAETEREFISLRTKQGLAAARANGQLLGRPKGSRNKKGLILEPFKDQIRAYLQLGLPISAIQKLINPQLERPLTYNAYKRFVKIT